MALFNFLKTTKPIQFDFKPRFYDQENEARQQRLKELNNMGELDTEGMKSRISGGFRRSTDLSALHLRRKLVMRSNLMVMALVMILAIGAFLLLNVFLPEWLNK
jgi:hypothetical protein